MNSECKLILYPQFENFVQLRVLYISCDGAGALPAARQHDLGQGGAALDEVLG